MRLIALVALTVVLSSQSRAQSVEEFYKGKTINLVIGFSVGGGYDLYARHLARHIGKYIPGKPNIVPQNLAGAGSLRAANFLFTAAPKDGLAFGTFARTTGINPLLETGATFDGTKFGWLGSVTNDTSACVIWNTSGVKTWDDFLAKPVTLALRLFGNIFAGTILLALIGLFPAWLLWAPNVVWKTFDLFIGAIQAFIFGLLTVLYFAAITPEPAKKAAH